MPDNKKEQPTAAKSSPASRSSKGDGMDPKNVSKMLALLKYQMNYGKNPERKQDAAHAFDAYHNCHSAEEKKAFLAAFESNGGGKSPGALKFATQFKKSVSQVKTMEQSQTEDFLTRRVCMHNELVAKRRSPKIRRGDSWLDAAS